MNPAPTSQASRALQPQQGAAARPLELEVWFDLICPWCLIGKRQLDLALAEFRRLHPEHPVAVTWRSQALLPDIPPQGLPFREFYLRRLGSAEAVSARQAQVRAAAWSVGIALDFSTILVMPDTRPAHGLIADAQAQCDAATVDALVEDLFAAHFVRGLNLGDGELLDAVAEDHGVRRSRAWPAISHRVSGVPLFVADRIASLSGAQAPRHLLAMLLEAVRARVC